MSTWERVVLCSPRSSGVCSRASRRSSAAWPGRRCHGWPPRVALNGWVMVSTGLRGRSRQRRLLCGWRGLSLHLRCRRGAAALIRAWSLIDLPPCSLGWGTCPRTCTSSPSRCVDRHVGTMFGCIEVMSPLGWSAEVGCSTTARRGPWSTCSPTALIRPPCQRSWPSRLTLATTDPPHLPTGFRPWRTVATEFGDGVGMLGWLLDLAGAADRDRWIAEATEGVPVS